MVLARDGRDKSCSANTVYYCILYHIHFPLFLFLPTPSPQMSHYFILFTLFALATIFSLSHTFPLIVWNVNLWRKRIWKKKIFIYLMPLPVWFFYLVLVRVFFFCWCANSLTIRRRRRRRESERKTKHLHLHTHCRAFPWIAVISYNSLHPFTILFVHEWIFVIITIIITLKQEKIAHLLSFVVCLLRFFFGSWFCSFLCFFVRRLVFSSIYFVLFAHGIFFFDMFFFFFSLQHRLCFLIPLEVLCKNWWILLSRW